MTVKTLIKLLQEQSKNLPKGLDSNIVLATGLTTSVEILSIYGCRSTLYIDVEEPSHESRYCNFSTR